MRFPGSNLIAAQFPVETAMSDARRGGAPRWLTLSPGETVRLRVGPSKNLLLLGIGTGMVLLVLVSVVVAALGDIATGRALSFLVVILVMAMFAGIYAFVHRWEYVVTSDRACVVTGLRSRERRSIRPGDIEEVRVEQSRWQRLVNVGDLLLVTDERTLRFGSVEGPQPVYEQLLAHVE